MAKTMTSRLFSQEVMCLRLSTIPLQMFPNLAVSLPWGVEGGFMGFWLLLKGVKQC